jgi:hypothetical protein
LFLINPKAALVPHRASDSNNTEFQGRNLFRFNLSRKIFCRTPQKTTSKFGNLDVLVNLGRFTVRVYLAYICTVKESY